jgi:hypothetical protein
MSVAGLNPWMPLNGSLWTLSGTSTTTLSGRLAISASLFRAAAELTESAGYPNRL